MSTTAPRTAREFADAGRLVLVSCRCGHEHAMDVELVIFMLGEDFPLATATAALSAELSCSACGASRPAIGFKDREPEQHRAEPKPHPSEALVPPAPLRAVGPR